MSIQSTTAPIAPTTASIVTTQVDTVDSLEVKVNSENATAINGTPIEKRDIGKLATDNKIHDFNGIIGIIFREISPEYQQLFAKNSPKYHDLKDSILATTRTVLHLNKTATTEEIYTTLKISSPRMLDMIKLQIKKQINFFLLNKNNTTNSSENIRIIAQEENKNASFAVDNPNNEYNLKIRPMASHENIAKLNITVNPNNQQDEALIHIDIDQLGNIFELFLGNRHLDVLDVLKDNKQLLAEFLTEAGITDKIATMSLEYVLDVMPYSATEKTKEQISNAISIIKQNYIIKKGNSKKTAVTKKVSGDSKNPIELTKATTTIANTDKPESATVPTKVKLTKPATTTLVATKLEVTTLTYNSITINALEAIIAFFVDEYSNPELIYVQKFINDLIENDLVKNEKIFNAFLRECGITPDISEDVAETMCTALKTGTSINKIWNEIQQRKPIAKRNDRQYIQKNIKQAIDLFRPKTSSDTTFIFDNFEQIKKINHAHSHKTSQIQSDKELSTSQQRIIEVSVTVEKIIHNHTEFTPIDKKNNLTPKETDALNKLVINSLPNKEQNILVNLMNQNTFKTQISICYNQLIADKKIVNLATLITQLTADKQKYNIFQKNIAIVFYNVLLDETHKRKEIAQAQGCTSSSLHYFFQLLIGDKQADLLISKLNENHEYRRLFIERLNVKPNILANSQVQLKLLSDNHINMVRTDLIATISAFSNENFATSMHNGRKVNQVLILFSMFKNNQLMAEDPLRLLNLGTNSVIELLINMIHTELLPNKPDACIYDLYEEYYRQEFPIKNYISIKIITLLTNKVEELSHNKKHKQQAEVVNKTNNPYNESLINVNELNLFQKTIYNALDLILDKIYGSEDGKTLLTALQSTNQLASFLEIINNAISDNTQFSENEIYSIPNNISPTTLDKLKKYLDPFMMYTLRSLDSK